LGWRLRLPWERTPPADVAADGAGLAAPVAAPGSSLADQVRELAKDLITIEVNTIVKENMTAGRMPAVPLALLNIAHSYVRAFERLRIRIAPAPVGPPAAAEPDFGDTLPQPTVRFMAENETLASFDLPADRISFAKLFRQLQLGAERAYQMFRDTHGEEREKDRILLKRISDNSETLWYLLKKYRGLGSNAVTIEAIKLDDARFDPPPELSARDLLIIKKIWEVGTEEVVAQTVVQLDGDIITRIAANYRSALEGDESGTQLLTLHEQGLETAIERWEALVRAAVAVVQGIKKDLVG
jgi:hypothetical protein